MFNLFLTLCNHLIDLTISPGKTADPYVRTRFVWVHVD